MREIVQVLREFGAKEVLVDGAHGPGQLDVAEEVPLMGADYYVANLHKVCCKSIIFSLIMTQLKSRNHTCT